MLHTPPIDSFEMCSKDLEAGAADDVSEGYVPLLLQRERFEDDDEAQSETGTQGSIGGGTFLDQAVSAGS